MGEGPWDPVLLALISNSVDFFIYVIGEPPEGSSSTDLD
jgi:hypothetical protein